MTRPNYSMLHMTHLSSLTSLVRGVSQLFMMAKGRELPSLHPTPSIKVELAVWEFFRLPERK